MKKETKNKKIKAATVICVAIVTLFVVSMGPGLIADPVPAENTYTGAVEITLTASDHEGVDPNATGVNHTYYVLDPEVVPSHDADIWTEYTAPIDVKEEGKHVIFYYSVDKAGNLEQINKLEFEIEPEQKDTTPPETKCDINEIK
jgi:hypothetical protein